MTPKLRGVAGALAKLKSSVDHRAEELLNRIEATEARADTVFRAADAKIAEHVEAHLSDVNSFLTELESATNSGPTLDGSPEPSGGWPPAAAVERR